MTSIDMTAALNAHREGYLAKPSIDSVRRAVARAEADGARCEVVVVLDSPDDLTRAFVRAQCDDGWKIFETDFSDAGAARTFAVTKSAGDHIAFLDADDLWGENWLTACVAATRRTRQPAVWHPEINIYFGGACHVMYHIDMESEEFDLLDLAFANQWTALACAPRALLTEIPYPLTDLANKLGYEDWGWNLAVIEKGYLHKVARGTGHVVRVKTNQSSLLHRTNVSQSVAQPTTAFRTLLKST
jgi:hypothetical protein